MKSWKNKDTFYRSAPSHLIFTRRFCMSGLLESVPPPCPHHTYRKSTIANETKLRFSRVWKDGAVGERENVQTPHRETQIRTECTTSCCEPTNAVLFFKTIKILKAEGNLNVLIWWKHNLDICYLSLVTMRILF